MNEVPLMVSVECLAYNQQDYIGQCLDGIVMQKTGFRFEAIVHDDASTDHTADIIREYAKKYPDIIKPVLETENQYSKHDNSIGRKITPLICGKYIAYCEGDDYWTDPLKLQKQVDFLEANPEYAMCFHRARILNETKGHLFISCDDIENREYSADELFLKWIVPTASILFRREVYNYKLVGYERVYAGDIVLILSCAETGKIRGSSEYMSVYRIHCKGITYDPEKSKYKAWKYPEHYEFIKDNFHVLSKDIVDLKCREAYLGRMKVQSRFSAGRYRDFIKALSFMSMKDIFVLFKEIAGKR